MKSHNSEMTCGSCAYLTVGGEDDNFKFACLSPNTSQVYLTNIASGCEHYKKDLKHLHQEVRSK